MLSINFTDHKGEVIKTYSAVGIKTGLVDKLMEVADKADTLQVGKPKVSEYAELLKDMKALIVAIFGNQFTFDELQNGAEQSEVNRCFNEMVGFISEAVRKN